MSGSLSERLVRANRDVWDAMQEHQFVQDVESDRMTTAVFERYLVFEHRFVETAVLIVGQAMLKAPGTEQRHRWIAVLHALSNEQLPAFAEFFASLGIEPAGTAALPASVEAFDRGMLSMAQSGDYADALAIMLAAEWMYATWCSRARTAAITIPELQRWVALHAEPGFLDQVAWLRAEIDALPAGDAHFDRLSARFRRALALEIAFHDAPYEPWPVRRRV
jgi:thiaminase (transcriptional activator TenA)